MNLMKPTLIIAVMMGATTVTMAETAVNHNAVKHTVSSLHTFTTVKKALTLKDDSPVKLKGYIVKAIGDEKYQFRDSTGVITVDIDDELWQGKAISAKTPVTITGEIDVDYKPTKRVEIDVEHIEF